MTEQLRQKKENLEQWMADHVKEGICIAFSAGVDSSLLLKLACDAGKAAGVPIWAVTFSTKLHPHGELEDARQAAAELGAEHIVLEVDERSQEGIQNNPPDRCYICKKYLFTNLLATAEKVGAKCVVEGTNEDDLHVYRPGIRAVRELHVNSPLALFHLTKAEVRALAAELGVQSASKPSAPCLITRLPYNTKVDFAVLEKVGMGEEYLKEKGLKNVRLRLHGDVIRIEVERSAMKTVLEMAEDVVSYIKGLGFCYVTLDLEGFRSGSMDLVLSEAQKSQGQAE